jgi:hypothetical protein
MAERTRIAREPHDTILQSFQALMLHFQTGSGGPPRRSPNPSCTNEVPDGPETILHRQKDAKTGFRHLSW